ncbi:Brp/Blh family beta-carotene 15,15'-dioxygenase [Flavobacterium sp.]|uniref:Brp/Blh family beta-carotene 15,15'-dioxygenase n=1 Tax=Flavobacterium sp. TaxID=239 RepID=UPI00261AFBB2|nr:Brp/Blh family beta-carotene 15,15'-dioxygenase [Flavobacterium sp.]
MSQSNKIAILISFFALWINMYFSFKYQQVIGFVVIFLFGILHGANDLALYQKINEEKNTRSLKNIVLYYIAVVFLGALLFYIFPIMALILFILFSGYHFGEQHWNKLKSKGSNTILTIFQTIYGLFILFLLFQFHEIEVKKIILEISNTSIASINFKLITIVIGLLLIISGILLNSKMTKFKSEIIINIFYLFVFAIIFKTADLIWAFAIYFVVWHSFPSIKEQIHFLYGAFTFENFKNYFKSAFIYWIISLFGIAFLYFAFKDKEIFNALFFSFLAAITFPHTIVIIKMQNKT